MSGKKRKERLTIANYKTINSEFFEIELVSDNNLPKMYPGQFVEVLVEKNSEVFLRRPLSIHNVNYEKKTIHLLVQIVGSGTKSLASLCVGESIDVIYPLGNSFNLMESGNALLIGGGCGIAPLLFLAKELSLKGIKCDIIIGARNKEFLLQTEEYKKYANVHITTEDGSEGKKGYVIHHPVLWDETKHFNKIFTCGPEAMMKAVAKYAYKRDIECEVSLENLMACGIGACLCCVVKTTKGNVCTCTDGPVFNIDNLTWGH